MRQLRSVRGRRRIRSISITITSVAGARALLLLRAGRRDLFREPVLLHLKEVLLSMRANLDDVLRLDLGLYDFPVATVLGEGIDERVVLERRPCLAQLGDDVGLARLLVLDGAVVVVMLMLMRLHN